MFFIKTLHRSKSKLEKAVEETRVKLVESTAQKKQLEKSYDECKKELEDLEDQVEYLQSALRQYKYTQAHYSFFANCLCLKNSFKEK